MGEAFLMNNGGGLRLKGVRVDTMPDKTVYFVVGGAGEDIDLSGARIVAVLGKDEVVLTGENYSTVPVGKVTQGTTKITVSATIGGITRRAEIPITALEPDPVLDNNPWDVIEMVSAAGLAQDIWNVGDVKTETVGGVSRSFRIIDFNHFDLAPLDPDFGNPDYNAAAYDGSTGSRYAGILFEATDPFGKAEINATTTSAGGWDSCDMRNNTLQDDYSSLPAEMRMAIKTVNIRACVGGHMNWDDNSINVSQDRLFLLSAAEMVRGNSNVAPGEEQATSQCRWYENHSPSKANAPQWTRSPHNPSRCSNAHFVFISASGVPTAGSSDSDVTCKYNYFPAFCI